MVCGIFQILANQWSVKFQVTFYHLLSTARSCTKQLEPGTRYFYGNRKENGRIESSWFSVMDTGLKNRNKFKHLNRDRGNKMTIQCTYVVMKVITGSVKNLPTKTKNHEP